MAIFFSPKNDTPSGRFNLAVRISLALGFLWLLPNLAIGCKQLFRTYSLLSHYRFSIISSYVSDGFRFFPLDHIWLGSRILLFHLLIAALMGLGAGLSATAVVGLPGRSSRTLMFSLVTGIYLILFSCFALWKAAFYFPSAFSDNRIFLPLISIGKRSEAYYFTIIILVAVLIHGLLLFRRFHETIRAFLARWIRYWKPATILIGIAMAIFLAFYIPKLQGGNEGPNVIILCFDSLIPEHLSSEGYHRETSPAMDKFRRESVFFPDTVSPIARTMSSWVSMLTGAYPNRTGIRWDLPSHNRRYLMKPNFLTELKKENYNLVFMTDDSTFSYMESDMGWDTIIQPKPGYFNFLYTFVMRMHVLEVYGTNALGDLFFPLKRYNRALSYTYQSEKMTDQVVRVLHRLNRKEKFFLAIHYDIIHPPGILAYPHYRPFEEWPYESPSRYLLKKTELAFLDLSYSEAMPRDRRIGEHQVLIYDKLFRQCDEEFARVWDTIRKLDLDQNTLIVLCSDHGEKLGTLPHHGNTLHQGDQANSAVLMIRFPKGQYANGTIDGLVSLIDIFPTAMDFLNLKVQPQPDGESLIPSIENNRIDPDRMLFAETGINYLWKEECNYEPDHPMVGNFFDLYEIYDNGIIAVDEINSSLLMSAKDFMVRQGNYKLVAMPRDDGSYRYSLFDVSKDKLNLVDIKDEEPDVFSRLKSALDTYMR